MSFLPPITKFEGRLQQESRETKNLLKTTGFPFSRE
jgi:hypothetical protein